MARLEDLKLADIGTADVVCTGEATPLAEVLALMQTHRISAVAVTRGHAPVGLFTERDALAALAAGAGRSTAPVRARMQTAPLICPAATGFFDGYAQMAARRLRHLLLADAAGALVGIVTESDFVRALALDDHLRLRTVAEVMVASPAVLPPAATLGEALALMLGRGLSSVLVVADGRPVGILTERDVHRLNAATTAVHELPLKAAMSAPLVTCTGDLTLPQAVSRMQAAGVRRLPVVDGDGRLTGIVSRHDLVKDLRARHEELLHAIVRRQSRELSALRERIDADFAFDALLAREHAPGIVAADARRVVRFASRAALRLTGLKVLEGRSVPTLVDALGGDGAAFDRRLAGLGVNERQACDLDTLGVDAESGRALSCEAVAVGDADGSVAGYLVLLTDVTEARRSEQRFRRLFEAAPLAMLLTRRADGVILDANPAAAVLCGYARAALSGRTLAALGLVDVPAGPAQPDPAAGGARHGQQLELARSDGSSLSVECFGERVSVDGEPCVLIMLVDVTPQMGYLRQIERQHQLLGAVFAAIADALILTDAGQRILLANPATERIFGLAPEQLPGTRLPSLFVDVDALVGLSDAAGRAAGAVTGALQAQRAGGPAFPAEVSLAPLRDVADGRQGCVVLVRDISVREQRERELAEQRLRLEDLVDTMADWVWEVDSEGRFTYCSERVRTLFGYEPQALLGTTPFDMMPPAEAERVRAEFAAVVAAGEPFRDLVNVCLTSAGEERIIATSGKPMRDAAGAIVGWRGTDRDITQSRRAAERLAASETQLRAIFDHANVGIMLLTGQRIITRANARLAEILGYASPAELTGRSVRRLHLSSERFDAFGTRHYEQLRNREQLHVEYQLRRRDGSAVWCLISGAAIDPVRPPDLARGVIWTVEDISALKENEAKLKALNARLAEEHELFTSGPAMVFRWLPQPGWPVAQCSPNAHRHLGVSAAELASGRYRFAELVHPHDLARVRAEVAHHSNTGAVAFEQEYRVRGAGGHWRHVYDYTRVRRNPAGEVLAYHGYLVDITERRLALAALRESEARYRTLFESAGAPMLTLALDGIITAGNAAAARLLGYADATELTGLSPAALSPVRQSDGASSAEQSLRLVESVPAQGHVRFEWEHLHREGHVVPVEVTLTRVELRGEPAVLGVWYDLRDRRRAEELEQRATAVFENTAEGIMLTDADNRIVAVNPAFTAITGYSADEAIGRTPKLLHSGRQDAEFYRGMWRQLQATGSWRGELWNRRKDGEVYAEWLSITEIRDADGTLRHRIGVFSDITRMRRSEEELEQLTHYDPITRLPNQTLLRARLAQAVQSALVAGRPLVLMLLNLDGFKRVVASFGHEVSDAVLCAVGERLGARLPADATLARTVGDTFAVVLELPHPDASPSRHAALLQEALRTDLKVADAGPLALSCCIGIALCPADDREPAALLRDADAALQRAKASGPNSIAFYRPELTAAAQHQLALEHTLRTALASGQFQLYFQPKLDLAARRIVGAEALVRWRRPDGVVVPPSEFMAVVEKSDLALDLDRWVLREAAATLCAWYGRALPRVRVSVNLSAAMLIGGNLAAEVEAVLSETRLDPTLLEVEVLENILIEDPDRAEAELAAVGALGVGIALDDFGTGYASLGYLKRFAFDYLKIDRGFISDLAPDSDDAAIVRATILMAHHLGIRVVAEGVEHDEQIRQLAALGCDLLQGYRIGRPMPAEDFVALLRRDGAPLAEMLERALVRHALLVGDDPVQHGRIATRLKQTNWIGHRARDAAAALAVLAEQPVDLVLCDLDLPDGDALALLRDLRRAHPTVPRLLLAAHIDTPTLLDAINRGGIHRCLPKPCDNTELDQAVAASYAHGLRRLRAEQRELRQG